MTAVKSHRNLAANPRYSSTEVEFPSSLPITNALPTCYRQNLSRARAYARNRGRAYARLPITTQANAHADNIPPIKFFPRSYRTR